MEVLYLLIPLVLVAIGIAMGVLFWAIKSGQYDDLDKESQRILLDDDNAPVSSEHHDEQSPSKQRNSASE
ncbi:cbb3-type cytochrome oxidase assembly protein CcoS [Aurantivibrio plasticivorans]